MALKEAGTGGCIRRGGLTTGRRKKDFKKRAQSLPNAIVLEEILKGRAFEKI